MAAWHRLKVSSPRSGITMSRRASVRAKGGCLDELFSNAVNNITVQVVLCQRGDSKPHFTGIHRE
jgi:hypothetical protein